jgi:hypothetical protein
MLQRRVSFVLTTLILCTIAGCAGRHNYGRITPSISPVGVARVVVATQDYRPYVINGEKSENFVGLQRNGYGIPFNVTTGAVPFAESFSTAACNALRSAGTGCSIVKTFRGQSDSSVKQKVSQQGSRGILFTIKEWRSDSMVRATVKYDVKIAVVNAAGKVLATDRIQGSDLTSDSIWTIAPARAARKGSERALKAKLEQLLGSPVVTAALRGNTPKQAAQRSQPTAKPLISYERTKATRRVSKLQNKPSGSCSTEQVLKMKEIGLSDEQIKSSCN